MVRGLAYFVVFGENHGEEDGLDCFFHCLLVGFLAVTGVVAWWFSDGEEVVFQFLGAWEFAAVLTGLEGWFCVIIVVD